MMVSRRRDHHAAHLPEGIEVFVYETQQRQIELRSPHVDNALAAFKQQPDAIVANRMALALTNVKAMAYTRDPFRSD